LPSVPLSDFDAAISETEVTRFVSIRSTTGYAAYRERLLGWTPPRRWPISGVSGAVTYSEHLLGE
jgi:hypothetical protein